VSTSVERRIDLSPSDWAMATWRKRPAPKAAGKPAPFDREACAAKLLRLGWKRNGEQPDWSAVEIPAVMSREEAHYWFIALTSVREGDEPAELVKDLAKEKITGRVSAKDVYEVVEGYSPGTITDEIVPVLRSLFSEKELGDVLLGRKKNKVSNLEFTLVSGLNWVIPALQGPRRQDARGAPPEDHAGQVAEGPLSRRVAVQGSGAAGHARRASRRRRELAGRPLREAPVV